MKEKTGAVFSIAKDNQPVAGCTISKEVYASGQDYISYFSLAKGTDISAEIYDYHKLLILHEGSMDVYTDKQVWTLSEGEVILTPTEIPVGMRTGTKAIYTEISVRRNTMNNAVKAGEVFKLAELIPYQEGKVLYSQHGDVFTDMSKVKDASETVKKNIYEFIDDNETIQLVVDCENSDPFKLASVLKQLDKESIQKIQKIVLYDDVHTTNAWRYLKAVTGIPVEHNVVERIKYDKSLVDIKIAMGISKAYYKDGVTAFILLSSDSDFWGVISSLPDAEFLVMVEEGKCGPVIQSTLENDGTYYCFMDDFCTGNIKSFKNAMFVSALKEEVEGMISLDTKELCDSIVRNLRMDISSTEKTNYYNKYIRRLRLEIDDDGIMRIKVQEE